MSFMRVGCRSANARLALALHIDRRVRLGLRDVEQLLARELEQREEGHHQVRHVGVLARTAR